MARNAQYGRSSEKLNQDQLELALEDVEQAVAGIEAEEDKESPAKSRERAAKRRANRGALPEHLPRIIETIAPESTVCPCCGEAMHEIGADESQRLDVVPAQFRVIVTRRLKFACGACPGSLVQAPAPERLIKGGLPTERLVAHVLAAKYQWHLPLYRQAQMMTTQGIVLDRSTLAFWVGYAAAELAPVYGPLRQPLILNQNQRGRDNRARAGFRTRPDENRLLLGDSPRRPAVARPGTARRCLHLRAGPRRGARAEAAR